MTENILLGLAIILNALSIMMIRRDVYTLNKRLLDNLQDHIQRANYLNEKIDENRSNISKLKMESRQLYSHLFKEMKEK